MLRSRCLVLLPLVLLLMTFRQAPLINPSAMAVTSNLSSAQVLKAIKMAFVQRGWTITSRKPGTVDSTVVGRDHDSRITIATSRASVPIKYVASTNLKDEMKKSTPHIHKNYLGWIQSLSRDIQGNLLLLDG